VHVEQLVERYPVPPGWSAPARFEQTVRVGESSIELAGWSAVGPRDEPLTGSAAAADAAGSSAARGYFELLERISVVDAMSGAEDLALLDREGRAIGRAARADVFPESPCPERWRYARSNGVALHRSWRGACDRAAAELVERDRVLRSWYGEIAPRRRALPDASVPNGLRAHADWIACELPARASAPGAARALSVVVVAGIPRQASTPLVYGFGAGAGARAAARAASEAVQRFGFLFGEDIPREPPRPSPTPDFHQEFFLYPPSHELFVAWLDGAPPNGATPAPPAEDDRGLARDARPGLAARGAPAGIAFVDLTPRHLRGSLFVARAVCRAAEPLVFGEPAPHRARVSGDRRVHPIA